MRKFLALLLALALSPAPALAQAVLIGGNAAGTTLTVELGATDNAVLDSIDADLTTIIGHVDGLEGSVDGLEALLTTIDADTSNLSVVGGGTEAAAIRVTIANNSTGLISVDDNGSTLSIDDGGGSITVDGSISCSNCTGTGASDVDDSSFGVGTDSVAPIGILVDETTPDSADEGDSALVRGSPNRNLYIQIRDTSAERSASVTAQNELLVELGAGSADIGNVNLEIGGTAITAGAGAVAATTPRMTLASDDPAVAHLANIAASLSVLDDTGGETADEYLTVRITDGTSFLTLGADWTIGTAHGTTGPGQLGVYQDFDGLALAILTNVDTELEATGISVSQRGIQYFMLVNEDGSLQYGTSTTPLVVGDGSGALNVIVDSGTITVGSITAGDNDIGNVDLEIAGTAIAAGAGTISAQSLRINIATDDPVNDALVDLDASLVAHDAADAGSTFGVGYRAIAHGTNPTAVAAADRTVGYANRAGIPFVLNGHPNLIREEVTIADADGAQTNAAVVTVSAGTKVVVTSASASCANTNSGDVSIRLGFGTATLPAASTTGAAGIVLSIPAFDANTGIVESLDMVIGADDEDLRLTMDDPVGGSCRILYSYYTIES